MPRPVEDAIERALRQQLSFVVLCERGGGVTSALNRCAFRLRRSTEVRVVAASGTGDAADLLRAIARRIITDSEPFNLAAAPVRELVATLATIADHEQDESTSGRHLVVAIDGAAPHTLWQLFGAHRDELWGLGVSWVVTADPSQRAEVLRPPLDSVFHVDFTLGELDPDESRVLVQRRVKAAGSDPFEEAEMSRIIRDARGNARRLIQLASAALAGGSPASTELGRAETIRSQRLADLGRAPAMLAAELAALGQASASDTTLLDRLGWTRPRAARVLAELDAAGLVTSEQRRSGSGRPRRVFRLLSSEEFARGLAAQDR